MVEDVKVREPVDNMGWVGYEENADGMEIEL